MFQSVVVAYSGWEARIVGYCDVVVGHSVNVRYCVMSW